MTARDGRANDRPMSRPVEIHGSCEPRFAAVRAAFAEGFTRHGEVGAACCVYHRGRPVVDLWGGIADPASGRAWQEDTAVVVFSATKGVTAICAGLLAERGALDLDAPVAEPWPEFAAEGKGALQVREMLAHRAGLPWVEGEFTLAEALDGAPVVDALARQRPAWPPGSEHGYHVRTFGWLAGEVVRRTAGRSTGRFLAEEIAAPLGLDLWIGLPEAIEPRVAAIVPPEPPADPVVREMLERLVGPGTETGRALGAPANLFRYDAMWNTRAIHAAELPSSNGIATARSLARLYAATIGDVDGIRLLPPARVADLARVVSDGRDRILLLPTRFGTGFMLAPALSVEAGPSAFGHPGAGGSLALAEPETGLALGYAMNRMIVGPVPDPRAAALLRAARASL